MIATRDLNGKISGRPFKVLAGREIPEYVLKTLDVENMKKTKQIKESSKKESKK